MTMNTKKITTLVTAGIGILYGDGVVDNAASDWNYRFDHIALSGL